VTTDQQQTIERIKRAIAYHENLSDVCVDHEDRDFNRRYARKLRAKMEELRLQAERDEDTIRERSAMRQFDGWQV
jgi:hypothetical protein